MLVSAVIPFYKELDIIGEAVASVFAQSGLPIGTEIEVCVGNDGAYSDQQIREAIRPEHRSRVRIDKNRFEKGPGGARNTAIKLSSGALLAFLDADDLWLPEKISLQLQAIEKGASFVTCAYMFKGRNRIVPPPSTVTTPLDIFWRQGIGTSTVLLRRTLIGKSLFRDFRFCQDIDFWYQIAQKPGFSYESIVQPLAVYSTGGSTKNKFVQAKSFWEVMQYNHIPLYLSLGILSRYTFRGIYNHYLSSGETGK